MRQLFPEEQSFLSETFGAALALGPIRVSCSLGRRSWSPFGARISLSRRCFLGERAEQPVNLADPWAAAVFAHEAVHVWQRQRGRAVTREGARLQTLYALGLFDPYAYDSTQDPQRLLAEFVLGNIEQQGKIFQDYVFAQRTGRATRRFGEVARWVRLSASK
jgi:hypothetical protein